MKLAYIYDAVYPWIKGGAEKESMRSRSDSLNGGTRFTGMG